MNHHLLKITVILSLLLSLCAPASAKAAVSDAGICGEALTWTLDDRGTLTIRGEGEMHAYTVDAHAPWYESRHDILTVEILPGVRNIGDWAFSECDALTRVVIADSVSRIGAYAFHLCLQLTDITIPNRVTAIEEHTFFHCAALTDITIPGSVTAIGGTAFAWTGLTHITIPNSVTRIGRFAFAQCEALTGVAIPDSVTEIENHAFYLCTNLRQVTIGKNVPRIEMNTFAHCDRLKTVAIPKSVTEIWSSAFEDCPALTAVKYAGTQTEWNNIKINTENDALNRAVIYYTVTQPDAATKTEIVNQSIVVTPMDVPENSSIVFACYRNHQLVSVKPYTYSGEGTISFTPDTAYDEVKIMAWEALGALQALGAAETLAHPAG